MGTSMGRPKLIDKVNKQMGIATDLSKAPTIRAAALKKLEGLCHERDVASIAQQVMCESHHLGEVMVLLGSRQPAVSKQAYLLCYAMTCTRDREAKVTVGKRVLEDLLEMLSNINNLSREEIEILVAIVSNLLSEDGNRNQVEGGSQKGVGGVPELVRLLDHVEPRVQLQSLRALTRLSERHSGRQSIIAEGMMSVVGLCFVGTLYGDIQFTSMRLLANLSKEEVVRITIGTKGILFRLTQVLMSSRCDKLLLHLVASVYCNYSIHGDLSLIEPRETMMMLYSLVFSNKLDNVIQGLWGIANCLQNAAMRREFVESDGLKLIFSVLKYTESEPQAWYEVARAIATIASGGHRVTTLGCGESGSDEEKEFLVREGCLEALVTIFNWCTTDDSSAVRQTSTGPIEEEERAASQSQLFNSMGEDIGYSARFLCMTMCTKALKHLTTFGYVCQLLCDLGGTKSVLYVLRSGFDTEGQQHASAVIANLALHSGPCRMVVLEDDAVASLVDLLRYSSHRLIHKEAAAALANIGRTSGQYQRIIIESGGPVALISVLRGFHCPTDTAIHTIRALGMLSTNEAKFEIMNAGGLPLIIQFSSSSDIQLKKACASAIRNLSELNDDSHQLVMVKDGVLSSLIELLKEEDSHILREASKAIAILTSRIESNKVALIEQDGVRVVVRHMGTTDDDLLIQILSTVGNLGSISGVIQEVSNAETIIRQLCYVLQMDRFALTLQAMRCLVSATKSSKSAGVVLSIIPASMLLKMTDSPNATLQRHAIHVIANLAQSSENCTILAEAKIIDSLERLFQSDNFDVILQTVQCIGCLLGDPIAAEEMRNRKLTAVLVDVAKKACGVAEDAEQSKKESKDKTIKSSMEQKLSSFVLSRNVTMLENLLMALKSFCILETGATALLSEYYCLDMFITCMQSTTLDVRKEAAGCLAAISKFEKLRNKLVTEGTIDQAVLTLRTSALVTAEMEKTFKETCQQLEADTALKNGMQNALTHAALQEAGLTYEEREHLMNKMDLQIRMRNQNSELQRWCLELLFNLASDPDTQIAMLSAYDWDTFMPSAAVQDITCQIAAARTCFKLLESKKNLFRFIELRGVSFILRALEYDDLSVKQLAAEGLGLLSNTDPHSFRRAILDEGGISIIMELTKSPLTRVRVEAFAAVAQLCSNKELGEVFVSQNVLQAIQLFSNSGKARNNSIIFKTLLQTIGHLAGNELIRWKVLEKGGATLLFRSLVYPDLSIVQVGSEIICKTITPELDLRECFVRCKLAGNVIEAVLKCPSPEPLRNVLRIFSYMLERPAYRDRVSSIQLFESLLLITDDKERKCELQQRAKDFEQQRKNAKNKINERRATNKDKDDDDDDELAQSYKTASEVLQDSEDDCGKGGANILDAVASGSLVAISHLLSSESVMQHAMFSSDSLGKIIRSTTERCSVNRIHAASMIIKSVLGNPASHKHAVNVGFIPKLALLSKCEHSDTRVNIAASLHYLSNTVSVRNEFATEKVFKGVKNLLSSRTRDIQLSCTSVIINLCGKDANPDSLQLAARMSFMTNLLEFVETDSEKLQLQALQGICYISIEMKSWFTSQVYVKNQAARDQCQPAIARIMGAYRRSLQKSKLASTALGTLCVILSCDSWLTDHVDTAMILELKRAATTKPSKPAGSKPPPKVVPGRSTINVHDYVKHGSKFPWDLQDASTRTHAARALLLMTAAGNGTKTSSMISVLKVLTVDDMVKLAYSECLAGSDTRLCVALLRTVGNCIAGGTQRHQLADDKTGVLKNLCNLLSHSDPHIIHAAIYILVRVSEEPAAHSRMIAVSGFDMLGKSALSFITDLLDVDTLCNGRIRKFDSGKTALLASILCEICRLISNLSDGGSAAVRSIREAEDTLRELSATLPKQLPVDARWHLNSALSILDHPPTTVVVTSISVEEFLAAGKDRFDSTRVASGVTGLSTLARDPQNHSELVSAGVIPVLCSTLRNPVPAIFKASCSALSYLIMGGARDTYDAIGRDKTTKERERAAEAKMIRLHDIVKSIMDEGVSPAVKIALTGKQDMMRCASKLISLILRYQFSVKLLQQEGVGVLLSSHFATPF